MADNNKNKAQRGDSLYKIAAILKKVWTVLFAVVKIAAGAAATLILIGVVCMFVLMGVLGDYLETDILPEANLVLENYNLDEPSYVYFVNNEGKIELLQKVHSSTDWEHAAYEDIPEALIHAAVAIEDKRFYEHQGVDWFTTIKAFANMFFGDETVGGSSITQQLIKNVTDNKSVTVQRKVMEFFQATLVEKNYDKDTIMEMYLNAIYLGQGCRGVRSAAETYFGKELQSLTVAECASLISITNNPSLFDPYSTKEFKYAGEMMNGMQRNRHRQMLVLGEMLNQGYITREEYNEAVAQELVLKNGIDEPDRWLICTNEACLHEGVAASFEMDSTKKNRICPECSTKLPIEESKSQVVYSYFVDTALKDFARMLAQKDGVTTWNDNVWKNYRDLISRSGYHIYTTYDEDAQAAVDKIYKDLKQIPKTRGAQQLQSAIVIIDNKTGDIVAMAGGVGDEKEHFGLNRATQSRLQSGSSIKPLAIYAPGFEQGTISPATVIKDLPIHYRGGAWPRNSSRKYEYSYTIYGGIEDSVNAVAANTLMKIGDEYSYEFAKETFGLSTMRDEDLNFASLALGAQHHGVTVRDMATAYATFANDGIRRESRTVTRVYNNKGELVLDNTQDAYKILSEKTVTYTNYCLVNAANRGTGKSAVFSGQEIAGKTGTTNGTRDRWFCGYTDHYTAAVWCGFDTPAKISYDGNPACVLWKKVMQPIHDGLPRESLYSTSKMTPTTVCLDSGLKATDACKNDIRGDRTETVRCYPEDRPKGTCTSHVDMNICSGGGVATDYCHKFAAVDSKVKITNKSLLKITQDEVDAILKAKSFGLNDMFTRDDYVYLVDGNGKDLNFKGFFNKINKNVSAPYLVCPTHTQSAWEAYEANHPITALFG